MVHFSSTLIAVVLAVFVISDAVEVVNKCNQIGDVGFKCTDYNPTACYEHKCIPELDRKPQLFDQFCQKNVCFLLKQEAPIVIIPTDEKLRKQISTPFMCNQSREKGIDGSLVKLLENTVAGTEHCIWVGDDPGCTWNQIQHLVASDESKYSRYTFSAGGPMLETAQRKCYHVPSSSWLDDRMVVVGNSTATPNESPWLVATNPLSRNAWVTFSLILLIHVLIFLYIGSRVHWCNTVKHKAAASYFLITGDEGNILESKFFNEGEPTDLTTEYRARMTRLTYLASIFRFSLKGTFLIFLIFYEAGLVNLLFFKGRSDLSRRSVGSISRGKLPMYCVMKDSALANVWRNRVDPSGETSEDEELRWKELDSLQSCLYRIMDRNDPVRFAVSYEREAIHQIQKENKAANAQTRLQFFELEDDIYRFNSGWLFKKPKKSGNESFGDLKRHIGEMNIDIVQSRVNGSLEKWLGDDEEQGSGKKITLEVLAICLVLFVYVPFFFVLLFLMLWGRLHLQWVKNLWCLALAKKKQDGRGNKKPDGEGV